jgi:hypothetical protein
MEQPAVMRFFTVKGLKQGHTPNLSRWIAQKRSLD